MIAGVILLQQSIIVHLFIYNLSLYISYFISQTDRLANYPIYLQVVKNVGQMSLSFQLIADSSSLVCGLLSDSSNLSHNKRNYKLVVIVAHEYVNQHAKYDNANADDL